MKYRAGMAGYVGVDPGALSSLAGLLDNAALELRGCAVVVAEAGAESGERVRLMSVAEWAEHEATDLRRRAITDRALGFGPFGGSQHGKNNRKHTPDELARLRAIWADRNAPRAARKKAKKILDRQGKTTGDRRNRQWKDRKRRAEIVGVVGGGVGLWWIGKAAAPACGPLLPLCALAL